MGEAIVCGVDGSAESQAAARVAGSLARRLQLPLVLVYVAQTPVLVGVGRATAGAIVVDQVDVDGRAILAQVAAEEELPSAELTVKYGLAAERLAEVAEDADAAFLVVGSRGRGGFRAAFLGSVSVDLVGLAPCPVVVVGKGFAPDLGGR